QTRRREQTKGLPGEGGLFKRVALAAIPRPTPLAAVLRADARLGLFGRQSFGRDGILRRLLEGILFQGRLEDLVHRVGEDEFHLFFRLLRDVLDVLLLQEARVDPQLGRLVARVAERRLAGLLHHVAELTRERDAALALHASRLDEEQVAARRRPGEASRHAR